MSGFRDALLAALLVATIAWSGQQAFPHLRTLFWALVDQCPAQGASTDTIFTAQSTRVVCATTRLVDGIDRPALTYFYSAVAAPLVLFPILESTRPHVPFYRARPTVAALFSHALLLPLAPAAFALLFLARKRPERPAALTQAHAEAALFGFLIGSVVLTGSMLALNDPGVTAVWQFAGLATAGAHYAHFIARQAPESGYEVVRAALLVVFMLSSSSHLAMATPVLGDVGAVIGAVLPSFGTSVEEQALDALKWTAWLGAGSTVLATLSFAADSRQLLGYIGWYIFALPFAGPGAAITGAMLWRESQTQPSDVVQSTVSSAPPRAATMEKEVARLPDNSSTTVKGS